MRDQVSSSRAFDPHKPEIRAKMSSLKKSGIIDRRLCLCEYRPSKILYSRVAKLTNLVLSYAFTFKLLCCVVGTACVTPPDPGCDDLSSTSPGDQQADARPPHPAGLRQHPHLLPRPHRRDHFQVGLT